MRVTARCSRRTALATGGVVGAAVLAGCGSKPLREKIRAGAHVAPADVPLLIALLDAEHYAIAAYTAGTPLLGSAANVGKQFLAQELAHAVELSDMIKHAGGKAPKPPASYDLGHPADTAGALALLEHAEHVQLQRYLDTLPKLSGGLVRAALLTIYANEAQHLAVVRGQAGKPATSGAFVAG